ncbi:MAG: phosphatase PAP2 family protein [Xanthomonadales bacterium]|nr:phosphatase PAP2 family protein [Xanthomonadales bacterium]
MRTAEPSARLIPAAVPRRRLLPPLVALLLALSLLAGFVLVLANVLDGDLAHFDAWLVSTLREAGDPALTRGPAWLQVFFLELTHLGGTVALAFATLAVAGLLVIERRPAKAGLVLVAVVGGTALSSALKWGLDRPRPDLVPHLVEALSPSFPSGHAMLSTVVYLTLGALLARFEFQRQATRLYVLACAIGLALAIGISRVYLGVHWPSDVLAGWCLGGAWAIACLLGADWLAGRRNGLS